MREEFEAFISPPPGVEFSELHGEYLENGVSTTSAQSIQLAWEIWVRQQERNDQLKARGII